MRLAESDYIERITAMIPHEGEAPREALSLSDEAVAAFPSSAELWCLRGDLIQITPIDSTNALSDALHSYMRAVEVDPDCSEAFERIGFFHDAVMDDPSSAEPAFREAISLGGGAECYFGVARVLAELNRPDEALLVLSSTNCIFHNEPEVQSLRSEIASGMWSPGVDT